MDDKNNTNMVPTTQEINASSPGHIALERFKLALTINDEESNEAKELKKSLSDS